MVSWVFWMTFILIKGRNNEVSLLQPCRLHWRTCPWLYSSLKSSYFTYHLRQRLLCWRRGVITPNWILSSTFRVGKLLAWAGAEVKRLLINCPMKTDHGRWYDFIQECEASSLLARPEWVHYTTSCRLPSNRKITLLSKTISTLSISARSCLFN